MFELKQAIKNQGKVIDGKVLKVDAFLNHQVDPVLMEQIGDAFYDYFKKYPITKVMTIESSGIAPAFMCAKRFNVPMVFIKKAKPSTMDDAYVSEVFSFTKNKSYTICLGKEFINEKDHILFIDDFLANGQAFLGVEEMIKAAGAKMDGVGIVIDKVFQSGHQMILDRGYDLYSLACIKEFKQNAVVFDDEEL